MQRLEGDHRPSPDLRPGCRRDAAADKQCQRKHQDHPTLQELANARISRITCDKRTKTGFKQGFEIMQGALLVLMNQTNDVK